VAYGLDNADWLSRENSKNICQYYFRKWGLRTYKKAGESSAQTPQRKRKAAEISTEDNSKQRAIVPAQGCPSRVNLFPQTPSVQNLEVYKEFNLVLHSIDGLKIQFLSKSRFYLTKTGVKVGVTTQEQVFSVHQGWRQTWLGLADLYNVLAKEWNRLCEEGSDEPIREAKERTTELVRDQLQLFVQALNGKMPDGQTSRRDFCDFFFCVMLTQLWRVCFRILEHGSTRLGYHSAFLTEFLFIFEEKVAVEFGPSHPLTRLLFGLLRVHIEDLPWAVYSAALSCVQGMIGNGASDSVISFWRGKQTTIPVQEIEANIGN
jgi:hypothetical protein